MKGKNRPDDNADVHGCCLYAETFERVVLRNYSLNSDSDVCIAVIVGKKREPRNPVPTFFRANTPLRSQNQQLPD